MIRATRARTKAVSADEWQAAQQRAATAPRGKRIKTAEALRQLTNNALAQYLRQQRRARKTKP